jgi:hypothetical protein
MHGHGARMARSLFDGLVIATALLFLSWTVALGPLWQSTDLTTSGGLVDFAYPFGDAVIVFFIVLVVRAMPRGHDLAMRCLLAGLVATALSDSAYAYLVEVKGYATGDILDAGWVAGYLGIALGAFCADALPAPLRRAEPGSPSLAALVVPFLPMLAALSVVGVEIDLGHRPDRAALIIAFALVVLVLARQALLLRDLVIPGGSSEPSLADRLQLALLGGLPEGEGPASPAPTTNGGATAATGGHRIE